jgi:hypothetical protein
VPRKFRTKRMVAGLDAASRVVGPIYESLDHVRASCPALIFAIEREVGEKLTSAECDSILNVVAFLSIGPFYQKNGPKKHGGETYLFSIFDHCLRLGAFR